MENVHDFYSIPARKGSLEISFGSGWRSNNFMAFEYTIFWVASTSELCALRTPIRDVRSDGPISRFVFGVPPHFNHQSLRDEEVMVEVLAHAEEDQLVGLLDGWEGHHREADGLEWVKGRLANGK